MEGIACCDAIIRKLARYIDAPCRFKQIRAFQILAGRQRSGDVAFLEENGAEGLSTFMAYYILRADALAGGDKMLDAMIVSKLTKYYEESGKMFRKIVGEPMEISSTAIREKVRRGEDISSLVPPSVAEYIRLYSLYREG